MPFLLVILASTLLAPALAAQQPAAAVHPYQPGIDVLDYELTLDIPDTGNRLQGRAVLTVRRTAPVDSLVLDLLALRVDSVLLDRRPTAFARDSATLRLPLPSGSADTFQVAVRYGGPVTDGLIVRYDSIWGWTAFGDNWPNRGRHWIPSVDHPSDKATVTWIVRAPSERTVVANGIELARRPIAGSQPARAETRWRMEEPIPVYLMLIAAAPLHRHDLGETACGLARFTRCVPQSVYVEPSIKDFLPGPFASAAGIVEFFASLVGPYPYRKLAHLESFTRFGGMENATAIFYADGPFRQRTMRDGIIAHEVAHQWFGNAVTETEWPHLWLSEGFATYFAALWVRRSEGDSAFRARMAQIRQTIVSNQVVAERPVIDTLATDLMALLNRNSYQKGGFVLHMLRSLLGDSAFFGGLRSYQVKYRNGNALSDDLRRELEASSGKPLGWFFDQWLRRPGYPELTTSWAYDTASRQVTLTVVQGRRFGNYRFPLTVEIGAADGSTTRTEVEIAAQPTTQVVLSPKLAAAPSRLVFDPDIRLLATFAEGTPD